jgi:purine-binding chemotaxis protein CheW
MNRNGQRINWDDVKRKLALNQIALEKALVADAARIESAYDRRAAQLAKRQAKSEPAGAALLIQVFWLGEQRYGIELSELTGVVAFVKCTPVPGAPPEFLGVINLRGDVRAVTDLSRLLGLGSGSAEATGYVLLLGKRGHEIGFRVDRLDETRFVRREELTDASDPSARYLKAFASDKLTLLNAGAILSHEVFSMDSQS